MTEAAFAEVAHAQIAPAHRFSYPVIRTAPGVSADDRVDESFVCIVNPAGRKDSDDYAGDVLVPAAAWQARRLDVANVDQAALDARCEDTRLALGILRLPDALLGPLRELARNPLSQQRPVDFYRRGPGDELLQAVIEHTRSYMFQPELRLMGVSVVEPGFLSTSTQVGSRRRVGIHIDSWSELPLQHRRFVRNRISWNIGREPRYLLLCPVHADDVYRLTLSEPQGPQMLPEAFKAWVKFQATGPVGVRQTTPVFRIRIDPGEAYLVSTDYWAHDAITVGKTELDITVPFLGYFRMPAQSQAWRLA